MNSTESPPGRHITDSHRIRRVTTDGIITTIAGNTVAGLGGENVPGQMAFFNHPDAVAIGKNNSIYIADYFNNRIRELTPPLPGFSGDSLLIASENGQELYEFNGDGKHSRTTDTSTGVVLYQFTYDGAGHLSSIIDQDGNTTTIQHDAANRPSAIVAPHGQTTNLATDPNGYLSTISNPNGESYQLTYTNQGLLSSFTNPRNYTSNFVYDSMGRLTSDTDAGGRYHYSCPDRNHRR